MPEGSVWPLTSVTRKKSHFCVFSSVFKHRKSQESQRNRNAKNSIPGVESYSLLFKKYFQLGKDKNVQKGQASRVLSKDPSQFPCSLYACLHLTSFPQFSRVLKALFVSLAVCSPWFIEGSEVSPQGFSVPVLLSSLLPLSYVGRQLGCCRGSWKSRSWRDLWTQPLVSLARLLH